MPPDSDALLSGGTAYFDVEVTSNPVDALTGVNVVVSLTDESFTSSSILYYWVGGSWQPVPDQTFVAPNTLQATVPASLLSGTPFAGGVGQPLIAAPENGFGALLSFVACATALATYVGRKQIGKSRHLRP